MNTAFAFDLVVSAIAASHVATVALITAWFALKKPKSWAEARRNFRRECDWLRTRWKEN